MIVDGCVYGKPHVWKFGTRERAAVIGELYMCGPFEKSQIGYQYNVLCKDNFNRFQYVYLMKEKSEVKMHLKTVLAKIQVAGHTVKDLFD